MVYDPQAGRRRPKPDDGEAAPVDALLGSPAPSVHVVDDPPPSPAVTPEPADPISDRVLISSGVATAVAGIVDSRVSNRLAVRIDRGLIMFGSLALPKRYDRTAPADRQSGRPCPPTTRHSRALLVIPAHFSSSPRTSRHPRASGDLLAA